MRYLLDVNALLALSLLHHEFHSRVVGWLKGESSPALLTCSITELGFVRVLAQIPAYGLTVTEAKRLLVDLKKNAVIPVQFVADGNDIATLPGWVKCPRQITDGHLLKLAATHGASLATLDEKIPGAYPIPALR